MNELKNKGAAGTGAASGISKEHATDWFLQYPVMSTLRPSYPQGPWHYKGTRSDRLRHARLLEVERRQV